MNKQSESALLQSLPFEQIVAIIRAWGPKGKASLEQFLKNDGLADVQKKKLQKILDNL